MITCPSSPGRARSAADAGAWAGADRFSRRNNSIPLRFGLIGFMIIGMCMEVRLQALTEEEKAVG